MEKWRNRDEWPDYGERVLAAYRTRRGEWVAEVVAMENCAVTSTGKEFPATHWMPLPAPPDSEDV